jgi:hypothetical protein
MTEIAGAGGGVTGFGATTTCGTGGGTATADETSVDPARSQAVRDAIRTMSTPDRA